jgi:hypothetical protein
MQIELMLWRCPDPAKNAFRAILHSTQDRCPVHETNPDWEDDLFERLNW